MNLKIVFFGSGWYTIPVVKKLIPHGLTLVVTTEKEGKLVEFCKSNQIDFISTHLKEPETIKRIQNVHADVAVLASYGAIIPNSIINTFLNGIINIHPSLLPKWKGPSPIQYTLLNGDTQTGVTLIRLDNKVDHGPILSQEKYDLSGNETTKDLLSILFSQGAEMVEELLVKLKNNKTLTETPQDHSKETWSYKIEKKDGFVDLSKIPTDKLEIENWKLEIARKVRAYYPWPTVWFITRIKNKALRIKLLPEGKIQVEGKNPMSYKDFINGFGDEGKRLLTRLSLL